MACCGPRTSFFFNETAATEIYAYVKENGEIVATEPLKITSWNEWHTAKIAGVHHSEGAEFIVGIYVRCTGSGNGAWGKIDEAILNFAD